MCQGTAFESARSVFGPKGPLLPLVSMVIGFDIILASFFSLNVVLKNVSVVPFMEHLAFVG